jgi:hypothetical protein
VRIQGLEKDLVLEEEKAVDTPAIFPLRKSTPSAAD